MIQKKKLNILHRILAFCIALVMGILLIIPLQAEAMTTGQEEDHWLLDTIIGRYNLNYTGNTNAFSKMMDGINVVYQDVPGWGNSSSATLSQTPGADGIVAAYLVWEVFDGSPNPTSPIAFVTPKGGQFISPDYVVNDWREATDGTWGYSTMYCMAADVTDIVKDAKWGTYSVCNIPYKVSAGGESSASWQLVVVEEGADFPVRAVSLSMGARFKMGTTGGNPSSTGGGNFSSVIPLNNGIKSKSAGIATGQIIFGASNADATGGMSMTSNMTTYSGGSALRTVSANTTYHAGLYRNGSFVNERDYRNNGCIRVDLSDISNVGNRADSLKLEVEQDQWTTFFMLGYSMDIAYPDFNGVQTTTVNDDGSVTVEGAFTNIANTADTGIYNGHLEVTVDTGLTPTSATAIVNGTTQISGVIDGNTVKFDGEAVASMMNGSTISYTVQCADKGTGATLYQNSAGFHGYLRSDGVNTRHWIRNMWTASSRAAAKYKVTVTAGTGIDTVTGSGMYTYGTTVTATAEVKSGYHWKDWTGDLNTAAKDFTFSMPAHSVTITANAEANTYTIHFDPNGGGEVTPIPDMTVRYDEKITLPDASDSYIKYTLDGVNVTQNVIDGTIVLDEGGVVMMMLDEETGTMMTPDGANVSEDGSTTKTNEDGSTTITYPDGSVTTSYPDGNEVTTSSDGIRTEIHADGSRTVTYPDGNMERFNADGTAVVPSEEKTAGTATGAAEATGGAEAGTSGEDKDGAQTTQDTGNAETTERTGTTESAGTKDDTEAARNTETKEEAGAAESVEAAGSTKQTASVERNAVSSVTTAVDGDAAETNTADMTSEQAELSNDLDVKPQPDKKAYESVFMGWAFEEEKDTFVPQWNYGEEMDVSTLVDAAGLTDTNGAVITLYAVWDDCPWIVADNLYYTLTQAQSGFITQDEILSHATAYDREDGSPIAPGVHENGTSFTIPDYSPTDFTQFQHEGSCTENLTVVDSVGNTYRKQITVYIVDTAPVAVKPEGTTRFIDEYYYNQPYENGGLEDNSIWKTDSEYAAVLQQAFTNSRNDSPTETYEFSHEDILEMKRFIDDNGFGNTKSEDALSRFYNQFMMPNRTR